MCDDVHGYLLRAKCGSEGALAVYPLVKTKLLDSLAEAERLAHGLEYRA